jgi:ABC-type proline/glycine betaine transport system permease subunit
MMAGIRILEMFLVEFMEIAAVMGLLAAGLGVMVMLGWVMENPLLVYLCPLPFPNLYLNPAY